MPSQQIPATPVGGITSRRHAKLLLHLVEGDGGAAAGGGASVKDLRLRRVVPPASATLDVSPECAAAAAKPGSVQIQSTPPEPVAAAEDRERKPMLPRSKLVRDPGSFGYRRLLPFLNQMANKGSDISSSKDMPSENKVPIPSKELSRSDSGLADGIPPVGGSQGGAAPLDSVEPPPVVKAVADTEICDSVKEETKSAPVDLASSKPSLACCTRSKFVHHPSSFSYKRMLPFLMENDISQEGDRAKFRRLSEEQQMTSDETDVQASGQIQSATAEVLLDGSAAEVQKGTQGEEPASVGDPLSSESGELASGVNAVPSGRQNQLPVSEDTHGEGNAAEVESTVEEKASKSDEKPVPMDSVDLPVGKAEGTQEAKDCCDSVKEETKIVPADLASSKPSLPRCMRSKFVPHRSSFSYKRMLSFLMENETSSQKEDMAKLQTVSEEKQLALPENDVLASGNHLSVSEGSPEACYQAELDRIVEEISSTDENYLLKGVQLQSVVPVAEVSLDVSTAEVQKVTQEVLASDGDLLSLDKRELTSERNDVLAGGQCQLAVSDGSAKESDVAEAERIVEEKATKSDENSVLNDRDESSGLASDKGEFLMKDQPQACDSKKLQCNADLALAQQCQSPESGCSIKTVMVDGGADPHGSPERHDSVASLGGLLLDVGMICKPSEPSIGSPLSAEGMSGCVAHAESGLSKVGTPSPLGSPCLEQQRLSPKIPSPSSGAFSGASFLKKRGFSPKKLSPKKGILKRHTMGCRGICMCLDCSVFRLRADRAFEFSRKQMQEADDIIVNLLEEVASLRSMAEKSSGKEQMEACQRALRVEEVAKERRQQMLAELNSHCKIPGPRVKFAQYVEGKMASSPSSSSRRQ
ncbi:uncharacterized protein LOC119267034 isoform X2 [Triticum dicoccoides]|uniref:uncharacterized protein LOC119267034 isoform X2 n=1 Tax=Triticum dicoccoides TaxID=85692 RepID=UPI00188DD6D3|nr:uncharacterized protein LOC119267034 isoform X2 [Triticum dicoccoides]